MTKVYFCPQKSPLLFKEAQREKNGDRRMHLKAPRDAAHWHDLVDGHGYEQHTLQGKTKIGEPEHHTGEWDNRARVARDRARPVYFCFYLVALAIPCKAQWRTHFHGQLCSCFSLARTVAAVEKTTTTNNLHINTSDMLLLKLPALSTFQHFYIILMAMKTTTFP